jgi:hypothetical protein
VIWQSDTLYPSPGRYMLPPPPEKNTQMLTSNRLPRAPPHDQASSPLDDSQAFTFLRSNNWSCGVSTVFWGGQRGREHKQEAVYLDEGCRRKALLACHQLNLSSTKLVIN